MYERYSRRQGWSFEVLEARGDPGVRLAVAEVSGRGAGILRGEAGAQSIQHITRSRNADRIHTSNASVVVLDASSLEGRAAALLRAGDVRVDTFRGRGKGGQHRNVTDSAVRVTHLATGETATVLSGRSQTQNRERALTVLAARLSEREREARESAVQTRRRAHVAAGRAQTTRVYDLVRDVVRDGRTGKKIRRVRKVLDGDLGELLL